MSDVLACFACGTATPLHHFVVRGPVCPTCDAKRTDAAVRERCAPLVEQVEQAMVLIQAGFDEEAWEKLAAALAHHAAQGAGRAMDRHNIGQPYDPDDPADWEAP